MFSQKRDTQEHYTWNETLQKYRLLSLIERTDT